MLTRFRSLVAALRSLFGREKLEDRLRDELQFHADLLAEKKIRQGMTPDEARRRAYRELGRFEQVRETVRDASGFRLLEDLCGDLRYGVRQLVRSPGFSIMAVLTLALGIGANTAIFSLINTIMLHRLPVERPEQLVELLEKYPGEARGKMNWSWTSYEHFRDHNHVFSSLSGMSVDNRARVRTEGSEPETVVGEYILGDYFQMLGLKAAVGRLIAPEDDPASPAGAVAVISWPYWQSRFQGHAGVVGKRIVVGDAPATIIGVAPRGFVGLRLEAQTDVWLPRARSAQRGLLLIGRLKPGITIEQARAEMRVLYQFTIDERVAGSKDPLLRQLTVEVEPAGSGLASVRDRFGKPLAVLMAIVALLLLLTCVNLASMLLARAAARRREMAVRIGLGAGRYRLLRQVLTESVLLSMTGTLAGLAVAYFGTAALVGIMASGRPFERIVLHVEPDFHILLFAAGIGLLTGLLFGIAPALSTFRSAPASVLRETGSAGETRSRRLLGKSLVAVQAALSLLLLSTAGLFTGHLSKLRNDGLGFRRDHVLLVPLDTQRGGYERKELARRSQELLDRLESIPGVRSATVCAGTPIQGAGAGGFVTVEGYQEAPQERRRVALNWVARKYFATLGTPLLAGRDFEPEDANRPRVAIINEAMARRYFAGRDPVGKHVTLNDEAKAFEIVGVVGNAKYTEPHGDFPPTMYLDMFQEGRWFSQYALRTTVAPASVAGEVRRAVADILKTVPIERITTLSEQVDGAMVSERLIANLSGFFGGLGALLAGIGLYGLLAYTVARRINEIGVRMALGATRAEVTRMVLRDALRIAGAGVVLGAPLAIWTRSVAASVVEDLTMPTAAPLAFGVAGIIGVALLASYLPARRASRVDPMQALRHE